MGKQPGPGQAKASLLAFHAAALRLRREAGLEAEPIPHPEWEAALCTTISDGGSILTRQSCADKTWFLERTGYIRKVGSGKSTGILLLPAPTLEATQ